MRQLLIKNCKISDKSEPFIIAEIGNNHQGNLELCKKMFRAASIAGATAVKLQKRDNRSLFTSAAFNKVYNSENSFGETYGIHREALEFGKDEYICLQEFADELGLIFFSTAFDENSLDFLVDIKTPAIKIASGDLVNHPLLKLASSTGIPLIVSTGASTLEEVKSSYNILKVGNSPFAILQCTSGYPSKYDELNISVIEQYRQNFPDTVIGFSSHENGISAPIAAYALGARIIEKHFTTDRTLKGTDQAFSLSTSGLERLCRDLKRIRLAMGDGHKTVYESEIQPMKKQRKSIVAATDLSAGTILSADHLSLKIPNEGLLPYEIDLVLGKQLKVDIAADTFITFDHIS